MSHPILGNEDTWFKKVKTAAAIVISIILFAGVIIGMINAGNRNIADKENFTVGDIVRTAKKAGLTLTANSDLAPADYTIGQAQPRIYHIKNLDGELLIYYYATIRERDEAYKQYQETINNNKDGSGNLSSMFYPKWPLTTGFAAKNMIVVVVINASSIEEYDAKVHPLLINLGKAIFYNLNGGKQIVYQGEGQNWKGKVVITYYAHFWKDQELLRYEGFSNRQNVLEYKGDTRSIHGDFSYEYQSSSGMTKLTSSNGFTGNMGHRESIHNYGGMPMDFGLINGGGIPSADEVITLTVKWNKTQETIPLISVN
ncbi:hypothetical protein LPY66_11760 [Dehalobacter sp. DCM]|uniref:hypothetical protein n=1 Tax=Dehalobacter sp. DCM TaxID=2907827 RepID=UPI0030817D66|nr:hypothetical protein LPY66_11760 [Dehalobacter sp. DCM]